jgi:hypothetical protein
MRKTWFHPREDIKSIVEFFSWHMRQRELRMQTPRKQLIQVLRLRQKQLAEQKRLELFAELR